MSAAPAVPLALELHGSAAHRCAYCDEPAPRCYTVYGPEFAPRAHYRAHPHCVKSAEQSAKARGLKRWHDDRLAAHAARVGEARP